MVMNFNLNTRESELSMERSSISTTSSSKSSSDSSTTSKLSKIGRRLRDSYRNLRGKNNGERISVNVEEYKTVQALNDSLRTKHYVAMDFSGKVGRIVDHKDIRDVPPTRDGYTYFRRKVEIPPSMSENQASIHKKQPWFHPNLSRDQAQRILVSHGVDGVFLVRDSSVSGGFVISYVHNNRIYHVQVLPDSLSEDNIAYYSLDEGRTKFFDLLQMIEYYQLNQGSLNTKLRYYMVKSPRPIEGGEELGNSPPLGREMCHEDDKASNGDDTFLTMDTNQNTKVMSSNNGVSPSIIQSNGKCIHDTAGDDEKAKANSNFV